MPFNAKLTGLKAEVERLLREKAEHEGKRFCPKCQGELQSKCVTGTDLNGREQDADWEECPNCGHVEP